MKKTQKKIHFFPLPPAPSPGYPQDPDPDPHEDFCPDPYPDPKKKCGSETLIHTQINTNAHRQTQNSHTNTWSAVSQGVLISSAMLGSSMRLEAMRRRLGEALNESRFGAETIT